MTEHEVVLVRHGQTEWSVSGQHTGRTDVPLTELGRRQADALGGMLGGLEFALVLSSPLSRAWETMDRAGYAVGGIAADELLEWDYGAYEGRRTADIRKEIPGWSVWTHPIVDGESFDEVGARADRAIVRALSVDGPVVMFAHGHLLRILAARWMGQPAVAGCNLGLDTATVSTLGWERENRVIRHWNEACHLRSMDPVL
ncbi:MAG: histidine phosphatase family protein [Acidimicrobiia bacterium]|nr:histidine phosphatase family protein [Acidimicrobiia bacterium]